MGSVLWGSIGSSHPAASSLRLTTDPAIAQLLPFEAEATTPPSPAMLNLQAMDATGAPLANAKIHLKLFTPPKTPWFTTDFPIVEGTTLLELTATAPTGGMQVQQMLPIRGHYQLQAEVTPLVANTFQPFQQTLTLLIAERGVKYRNLAILVALLLLVGLGGGWVIGEPSTTETGALAPQRVRLLLSGVVIFAIATLLFISISAEVAHSHTGGHSHSPHSSPGQTAPDVMQVQNLKLHLEGSPTTRVGNLANFQVEVTDAQTRQPVSDVNLKVQVSSLEGEWTAFAYAGVPDATGQLKWQQQFFDGAPHQVLVEVSPQATSKRQFQPFQVAQVVEVEGVAPPLATRLISLLYLTSVVAIGMLAGEWLRSRSLPWQRGSA
ncbi:MAG: hypothetical protein KME16_25550 [Scytolyngbya sp. HA4215-MV1]|nr:hypothetical protein [Scytolyngbya sp. HA4215-MV1]